MSQLQVQPASPLAIISFDHVFEREPLAIACIQALTKVAEPGSGLKLLRLVSKQANRAMQKHIRGFTAKLDGLTEELPDVNMLKLTQLLRLRVLVSTDSRTNSMVLNHIRQMQRFIMAAGPSLQTVRTIDLSLNVQDQYHWHDDYGTSDFDIAAVLVPLAHICPTLQHLRVSGEIGSPLLAAFGAACIQLTSMDIEDLPVYTSQRLSELLPQVTSTRMTLKLRNGDYQNSLDSYHLALSSCSTLTRLDIPGIALTAKLWRALPPSIQELHIGPHDYGIPIEEVFPPSDADGSMPGGLQLPNLKEVVFQDSLMHLSQLARILRAAPRMQRVGTHDVWVPCRVDQIPDLVLVNQRMAAGLVVSHSCVYRHPDHKHGEGLVLQLKGLSDNGPESAASLFLASLPVFEQILNIRLGDFTLPQAAQLARAFCRLRMLGSFSTEEAHLDSSSFPCLAVFPSLEILSLSYWYSAAELAALCLCIPSLRYLNVSLSPADREPLIEILDAWGRDVVVSKR